MKLSFHLFYSFFLFFEDFFGFSLILITFGIFSCSGLENKQEILGTKDFVIAPHFLIDTKKIDEFYSLISNKYKNITKIIIFSPNHFGSALNGNFKTFCNESKLYFNKDFVQAGSLKNIPNLNCSSDIFKTNEDGEFYMIDHGIGSHFGFINKYFPKATVYPIIFNALNFEKIDDLKNDLNKAFPKENVLFISSVDFSHNVQENFAYIHDQKTYYTLLNSYNKEDYKAIDIDCPSCLYLVNNLAKLNNKYPNRFYRDSSSTVFKKEQGYENTSRQFYYFDEIGEKNNGITFSFFGDLIYDRQVSQYLDTNEKIKSKFSHFYNKGDTKNDLKKYYHRWLFGLDFAGFNLEMPAVKDKSICLKSVKTTAFCGDYKILGILKNLGFNLANIANNHSMDGGTRAHLDTVKNLENAGINYFGYIRHGSLFEKNYTYTGTIRGINVAFHGFDFVITKKPIKTYCNILKKYKENGYLNIVNTHFGSEYETKHRDFQESIGKQLIDCNADIIIGHHPHVVQDIGFYKGKPIIYSLGNFLFDQGFSEETKKGMYLLLDMNKDGTSKILTGSINSYIKDQIGKQNLK